MSESKNAWIQTVSMGAPSIGDNTADADRLIRALQPFVGATPVSIDLSLLKELPHKLRSAGFEVRCVLFRDRARYVLIDLLPLKNADPVAGLAVDLGTTQISLRLIDLETRETLGAASFANPQASVGADILTRIHFSEKPEGLKTLTGLILDALNRHIRRLCGSCGMEPSHVFTLSVAGNTTMTQLFLGVDPHWLIREPYIPAVNRPDSIKAKELSINVHPGARVFVFPNVGSYLGGDLIAGILYSGIHRREETAILVDVGTNAEVILGNTDWMIGCAGAAGPALESGVTRMGMTAGPGVIDQIGIGPKTESDAHPFVIHTIDDLLPRGICGSGVIDLAACLFRAGMIDIRGKLVPERCGSRHFQKNGMACLTLVTAEKSATETDIVISQADLDSLIRSKAAMYTILETITATVGVSLDDLPRFYVAGAFGAFINPRSAVTIGMLPDLPPDHFQAIGNSALEGAAMAITSEDVLDEIDRIRDGITYLELNVNQDFMNRFSAAKFIPHTDTGRFPSVKRPE
jgi:uncharacterized 2Fe-2S/4Fe-4S cluster protein (DUF4445 family)